MKKFITLLIMLNLSIITSAQNYTFTGWTKFNGATKNNEATRVLVMDTITQKTGWVLKSSIAGTPNHNELDNLQGGQSEQYYHLTLSQYNWVKSQLYVNHSATFNLTTTTGERGVNISNTLNYNIISNDDVITSASINPGIGSVLSNIDTGAKTITGLNLSESLTYTLSIGYTRNGVTGSQNRTASYTAYNPQWFGVSNTTDITVDSYSDLITANGFTKYVGSSTTMNQNVNTAEPKYVWFISTANINKITASGFDTTIANWGDTESFFWKKSLASFKLSNGTNTVTLYLYRTRLPQNTGGSTIPYSFNP